MTASEELIAIPGSGTPRSASPDRYETISCLEEESRERQGITEESVRNRKSLIEMSLPVFWDGKPGTLEHGMVCRQGKFSVIVSLIVPCINGMVIVGTSRVNGRDVNVYVAEPLAHPLSSVSDECERLKFWEYDQL